MMKHTLHKFLLIAGLCALGTLTACGGGGGNAGTSVFDDSASNPTGPVAADLIVQTSKANLDSNSADTVAVTVTAVDANRQTIGGVPISFRVDNDALLAATSTATDESGKIVGTLSSGPNRSNRVITVTVISGKVSRSLQVQVIGATISATAVPNIVAAGQVGKVTFRVTDKLNAAIADEPIEVAAPGLEPSVATGRTDSNGVFDFNFKAPTPANGAVNVTATAAGTSGSQIVQLGSVTLPDVTDNIVSASVQASPSVVSVNAVGSTRNRAEVRALFVGADNKPIPNVRVRFDLAGDAQSVGGVFSSGAATIFSNGLGVATAAYIPADRSSPTNGVTVRACYAKTDALLAACATSVTTTLTISSEPIAVTIGTDPTITRVGLRYEKKYVVSVVDSAGAAMSGVGVTASVVLYDYRKGRYTTGTNGWELATAPFICASEDINTNFIMELGEDLNGNGRLDPRPSEVTITNAQSTTDADGITVLSLLWPQNYSTWTSARITVTARGVAGTEARDNIRVQPLPAEAQVFRDNTTTLAFMVSPYGEVPSCTSPN